MKNSILYDLKTIAKRDPAAKGILEVLLLYPGFHAVVLHRVAHWFYKRKFSFIARIMSQIARFFTGIEIHPGAKIGSGLFIDHGMGIVIGETAVIGDNCTIYHGVTLGGTGKEIGKRHPTIGDNVLIGAGAIVLGPVVIGDSVMIGAGAVVVEDVEEDTTVTGSKARVVRHSGKRLAPSFELDQIHLPDPLAQELCKMIIRIEKLEKQNAMSNNNYSKTSVDCRQMKQDDEKGEV